MLLCTDNVVCVIGSFFYVSVFRLTVVTICTKMVELASSELKIIVLLRLCVYIFDDSICKVSRLVLRLDIGLGIIRGETIISSLYSKILKEVIKKELD